MLVLYEHLSKRFRYILYKFSVLYAVRIRTVVSWVVTECRCVLSLRGTRCHHFRRKIENAKQLPLNKPQNTHLLADDK